ncbi:mucin-binding protein, partial [Lactococcus hodotermopsidis]|uniref:mucin-binding protein n=1 Tax=Pseudolactococcus hodotermopsidis TaxID=2709157 RepID=UPI001552164B
MKHETSINRRGKTYLQTWQSVKTWLYAASILLLVFSSSGSALTVLADELTSTVPQTQSVNPEATLPVSSEDEATLTPEESVPQEQLETTSDKLDEIATPLPENQPVIHDAPIDDSGILSVRSEPNVVTNESSTTVLEIDYSANLGDLLTISLPAGADMQGEFEDLGENGGSVEEPITDGETGKITGYKIRFWDSKSIKFYMTLSFADVNNLQATLDDIVNGTGLKAVKPGNFETTFLAVKLDGTSYKTSCVTNVEAGVYIAGNDWKLSGISKSYMGNKDYTFSVSGFTTEGSANGKNGPLIWEGDKTTFKLDIPAGFELNVDKSPGWTQPAGVGTPIYRLNAKDSPSFVGQFTSPIGEYSSQAKTSTITGYFGYSTDPVELPMTQPFKITIVEPDYTAKPNVSNSDSTVTVANHSNVFRDEKTNYAFSSTFGVPTTLPNLSNVNQTLVAPPDGSTISAFTLIFNPESNEKSQVRTKITYSDGKIDIFENEMSGDNNSQKFEATSPITIVKIENIWDNLETGSTIKMMVEAESLEIFSDNKVIEDNDQRDVVVNYNWGYKGSDKLGSIETKSKVTYRTKLFNYELILEKPKESTAQFGDGKTYNFGLSVPATGNDTTVKNVIDPIVYYLLPKGTQYLGVDYGSVSKPEFSTYQIETGQTVVKLDWTGTGTLVTTELLSGIKIAYGTLEYGKTLKTQMAVYLSTKNDSDLNLSISSWGGEGIIKTPLGSEIASQVTQKEAKTVFLGASEITINSTLDLKNGLMIESNTGTIGTKALNDVIKGGEHHLIVAMVNTKTNSVMTKMRGIVNLPDSADGLRLELNGAAVEIVDENNKVSSDVRVLYSTKTQEVTDDLSLTGYVSAEDVKSWSDIRSFIVVADDMPADTIYYVRMLVTAPNFKEEVWQEVTIDLTTVADTLPQHSSVIDEFVDASTPNEEKTITKTIRYVAVDENGKEEELTKSYIDSVVFKKIFDATTGKITYAPESAPLGFQELPEIKGYKVKTVPSGSEIESTVKFGDANINLTVVYEKLAPTVTTKTVTKTIHYVDENGKELATSYTDSVTFTKTVDAVTDEVTYSPVSAKLGFQELPEIKGYKVKTAELGSEIKSTVKFGDANINLTVVYEKLAPTVTTKTVTKTIRYVDENGKELATSYTDSVKFTKTVDAVTDEVTYSPESATLDFQKLPEIKGYKVKTAELGSEIKSTVKFGDDNIDLTVVYEKLAPTVTTKTVTKTIHYVDEEGEKLAPDYEKSVEVKSNLESENLSGQPNPPIEGYDVKESPEYAEKDSVVKFGDKDIELTVIYRKQATDTVTKTIRYVDEDGKELIESYKESATFKRTYDIASAKDVYSPVSAKLGFQELPEIKGYKVKKADTGSEIESTVKFGDDNIDLTVVYEKLAPTVTTKTVTKTIHYVDENGKELATSYTDSVTFTKTVDAVTDEVTYSPESATLDFQKLPEIKGYKVKTAELGSEIKSRVTFDDEAINLTVVYEKLAPTVTTETVTKTVHYIDETGKQIAPDHTVSVTLTKSVDAVTDEVTYTPVDAHLAGQNAPTVPGYVVQTVPDGAQSDSIVNYGD